MMILLLMILLGFFIYETKERSLRAEEEDSRVIEEPI